MSGVARWMKDPSPPGRIKKKPDQTGEGDDRMAPETRGAKGSPFFPFRASGRLWYE